MDKTTLRVEVLLTAALGFVFQGASGAASLVAKNDVDQLKDETLVQLSSVANTATTPVAKLITDDDTGNLFAVLVNVFIGSPTVRLYSPNVGTKVCRLAAITGYLVLNYMGVRAAMANVGRPNFLWFFLRLFTLPAIAVASTLHHYALMGPLALVKLSASAVRQADEDVKFYLAAASTAPAYDALSWLFARTTTKFGEVLGLWPKYLLADEDGLPLGAQTLQRLVWANFISFGTIGNRRGHMRAKGGERGWVLP